MIARNGKFLLTILSFTMILMIFINLSAVHSLLLGVIASVTYFLTNGSLLGRVFFEKEPLHLKLMFGNLLFLVLLGFVSWLVMIAYNLDVVRSVIALCIATTLSSLMGLKVKHVQWDPGSWVHAQWRAPTRLGIIKLLYFSLIALSFYLLLVSRSAEVHTVWEVMHPAFIPAFFASTLLLLALIFSSEKAEYKLLFTIIHSVLSHFLFVIIFLQVTSAVSKYNWRELGSCMTMPFFTVLARLRGTCCHGYITGLEEIVSKLL